LVLILHLIGGASCRVALHLLLIGGAGCGCGCGFGLPLLLVIMGDSWRCS
jgi:hypothetical protein